MLPSFLQSAIYSCPRRTSQFLESVSVSTTQTIMTLAKTHNKSQNFLPFSPSGVVSDSLRICYTGLPVIYGCCSQWFMCHHSYSSILPQWWAPNYVGEIRAWSHTSRVYLVSTSCLPRVHLVSTSCPPRVRLVSASCPPRVRLVSASCPPRVHLVSTSCPPRVYLVSTSCLPYLYFMSTLDITHMIKCIRLSPP